MVTYPVPPVPNPVEPAAPEAPKPPVSTATGRQLVSEAATLTTSGDRMGARRVLHRLTRDLPDTLEGLQAAASLAEHAADTARWPAARRWARVVSADALPAALRDRRDRVFAMAYEGEESYEDAARAWTQLAQVTGDPRARVGATEGAARSHFLAGAPAAAEATLREVAADQAPARLAALVEQQLTHKVLERLYGTVPASDPWRAWVALRFARQRCAAKALPECQAIAEEAHTAATDPRVRAEAAALLKHVGAWNTVTPNAVGVLLPLSGTYQKVGMAALEGIQLAAKAYPGVQLVVRDTKGDPEEAARQARALVLERHVGSLLGPVGQTETKAVIEVAVDLEVPLVVLGSVDELGSGQPGVLRFRLSRKEQSSALARYVVTQLGVKRAAILYPDHASGRRAMSGFWRELVRVGGEVRAIEAYPPGTEAFDAPVKRLLGARRPGSGTFDFEALFIPDDALTVRRLAPFLKAWSVRVRNSPDDAGDRKRPAVQLLGSAGWAHSAVVDRGEYVTDNAIFVAPYYADPKDPEPDGFTQAFQARYRRAPLAFHAEVHDATAMLLAAVPPGPAAADHSARRALLHRLLGVGQVEGATGVTAVLTNGTLGRTPWLLTVDMDTIRRRAPEAEERRRRLRQSSPEDQAP